MNSLVCPRKCRCVPTSNGISITGGVDAPLTQLPGVLPLDMVELRISGSSIGFLRVNFLQFCSNLTLLDLSNNNISRMATFAFHDLVMLRSLSLARNRLFYNATSFPVASFLTNPHLQTLILDDQKPPKDYYCMNLTQFEFFIETELPASLKVLYIELPFVACLKVNGSAFAKFTNLDELGLSRRNDLGVPRREACVNKLTSDTFEPMKDLSITKLKLRFDNLKRVEPLTFSWFRNLKILDMSHTTGMSVADFYPAWTGLKKTQLSKLILTSFKQDPDFITPELVHLNSTFFDQFDIKTLHMLYLDDTNIRGADEWNFHGKVPNLEFLTLANNSMDYIQLEHMTWSTRLLDNLKYLNFSFQNGEEFLGWDTFKLILSSNIETLAMLGVNECLQYHDIKYFELVGKNRLSLLDLRYNFLRRFPKFRFEFPSKGSSLSIDLSHNAITYMDPEVLGESIEVGLKLDGLLLSYNSLGRLLDADVGETFRNYRDLEKLDLSRNEIAILSAWVFENLAKLQSLNLSGNYLDSIDFRFSHMTDLRHLDLSNNKISRLNSGTISDLNTLTPSHPNLTIDLRDNVFECSCETLTSLQWILNHKEIFLNFEQYHCLHQDTRTTFNRLDNLLPTMQSQCSSVSNLFGYRTSIVVLTVIIIILCIVLTIDCVYKRARCCHRGHSYFLVDQSFDMDVTMQAGIPLDVISSETCQDNRLTSSPARRPYLESTSDEYQDMPSTASPTRNSETTF